MPTPPRFAVGTRVTIQTGAHGGRVGTITRLENHSGQMVATVEFMAPRFFMDPDGEQETKRLPYALRELAVTE